METRVEYEKVDSYKEELPCDECGAVTRTWKLMRDKYGRRLCKDCYDKITYRCWECGKMFNRKQTTFHIENGNIYCDECYHRTVIPYRDAEGKIRKPGYEEAGSYYEEYPCPECGAVIETWRLKTASDGRKVCEDSYEKLLADDWLNDILRIARHEDNRGKRKNRGSR